jgi:tetratricopeptide (TPR) repeat protein
MVKSATARRYQDTADVLAVDVGQRVRAARQRRGMSLAQLGGDDLTRSFLSQVELGRSRISLRALSIVARRLELPIEHFLADSRVMPEASAELTLDGAESAASRGEPAEALRLLEDVQVPQSLRARLLWLQGWALVDLERARDALPHLTEAVTAARERKNLHLALQAQYTLATALYASGSFDEAMGHLRSALDELPAAGEDTILLAKITVFIGHILFVRGDVDGAITHYTRAAELFDSVLDLESLASMYAGLSLVHKERDDMENALRYSKMSVAALETTRNLRQAARELNTMAARYGELGQLDRAMQCARDAIARAQQARSIDMEVAARSTLASTYERSGDYEAAQAEAEEVVRRSSEDKPGLPTIHAWLVLAKVAGRRGDYEEADRLFGRALEALEAGGHRAVYADAALAYSLVLKERGDTDHALDLALRSAQAKAMRSS